MAELWNVESLEDFLYYCCPECNFKHEDKEFFQKHASEEHPKAEALLFDGREVAKIAANELIENQRKTNSPSIGTLALAEALLAASNGKEDEEEEKDIIHPTLEEYNSGNYSPIYITANDLDPGTIVMTEAEDESKREIIKNFRESFQNDHDYFFTPPSSYMENVSTLSI